MDKKIWSYPIQKEHRNIVYFMAILAIGSSIAECAIVGAINILWLIPLSLVVVYVGFVCGGYLNKWIEKKVKD